MVLRTGPGAELAVLAGGGPGASAVVSSSTDSAPQCQRPQGKTTVSLLGALSEGGPRKTRMEEFSGETGNLSVFKCWPKTIF